MGSFSCTWMFFSFKNEPFPFDAQYISPEERSVTTPSVMELILSLVANAKEQQKKGTPLTAFAEPSIASMITNPLGLLDNSTRPHSSPRTTHSKEISLR